MVFHLHRWVLLGSFAHFSSIAPGKGGGGKSNINSILLSNQMKFREFFFFSFILIEDERKELRFEDTNPERKILARNGIPGCFQSLPIETKLRSTFETPTSELGWNNQQPDNGATIDELT